MKNTISILILIACSFVFFNCGFGASLDGEVWHEALLTAKKMPFPEKDNSLSKLIKIMGFRKSNYREFRETVESGSLVYENERHQRIVFSCDPSSLIISKSAADAMLEGNKKDLQKYLPTLHDPNDVKVNSVKFFDKSRMIFHWK